MVRLHYDGGVLMLDRLEYLADELTAATHKAQTLLTDFGIECENAELDGLEAPAEFDEAEKKQLASIRSATRAALRLLTELESKS